MTVAEAIAAWAAVHSLRRHRLIGVSGGRDSMALLHALHQAGARLTVCHLDHRLRGAASAMDARFVSKTAERLGIPCLTDGVDVAALGRSTRQSLEAAGRSARHRFLAECARQTGLREVFMAHHADDQVETILMHLFRGSAGLCSMQECSPLKVPGFRLSLSLLRPFLQVSRAAIDEWMAAHRYPWREDRTNAVTDTVRNRVRLELIPAIQRATGRDFRPPLLRAAAIAGEEALFLDSLARPFVVPELAVKPLQPLHPALQRRIFRLWLDHHRVPDAGAREIEALLKLLQPGTGPSRINLPRGLYAERSAMLIAIK